MQKTIFSYFLSIFSLFRSCLSTKNMVGATIDFWNEQNLPVIFHTPRRSTPKWIPQNFSGRQGIRLGAFSRNHRSGQCAKPMVNLNPIVNINIIYNKLPPLSEIQVVWNILKRVLSGIGFTVLFWFNSENLFGRVSEYVVVSEWNGQHPSCYIDGFTFRLYIGGYTLFSLVSHPFFDWPKSIFPIIPNNRKNIDFPFFC